MKGILGVRTMGEKDIPGGDTENGLEMRVALFTSSLLPAAAELRLSRLSV